ncbi:MAG: hypothetical protein M1839_004313 [Geoglossum umbratile]|nr:MAG: hypothetical protein M1839_004313 [Geoglossum umbratile]
MHQYALEEVTRADYAIDDSTNGIALRADLRIEFDDRGFVLMRKSEYGYTVHCLRTTPDILPAQHNRQTRPLTTVRPELIYTRLAYAILPRVSSFLSCGRSLKRVIRLKAGSGAATEIVDVAAKEIWNSPIKSQNSSRSNKSERASPTTDGVSHSQDLHSDPYQASFNKFKRKRTYTLSPTTGSQPSTPRSGSTSYLPEKELQNLKKAMIGLQRPPGYASQQKEDGEQMGFTWGLCDERKGDFEGKSLQGIMDEVVEALSSGLSIEGQNCCQWVVTGAEEMAGRERGSIAM